MGIYQTITESRYCVIHLERSIFLALLLAGKVNSVRSVKARFPSKLTTALQYLLFLLVLTNNTQLLMPLALLTAATGLIATVQYAHLIRLSLREL